MKDIICKLFAQCNLPDVVGDITPVAGGLMHKMYKVQTASGTYAVKCLNPQIMKRSGVFENYALAEALEKILEENGIPIVPALAFDGKKMLESDGMYFYIFAWQNGHITDAENISKEQCYKAGEILGRIHALNSQNVEPVDPELSTINFSDYLSPDNENLELLEYAQTKLNQARRMLPPMKAISNDDMDPKNIMWQNGEPHVIDLECLGYSNPIESCLSLALQWSGTVNEKFNKENLVAFFKGYLSAYDNGFRSYDELFGIAYTWLEWLEYNFKRAQGLEGTTEEEIQLGRTEVISTIARIKYLRSIEKEVCDVLKALPPPQVKNYKTHDDSLCYIDLTFEGTLDTIPHYELPEGFSFVNYKPGDKAAWIDIELSAGEVLSLEHGQECWNRYYGSKEVELPDRMFFIEDKSGNKIATATAFYDIHTGDSPDNGQLHWVAIKKEAQGKGLSKPLITHTLEKMKTLGYGKIKIHTQTNTWLACKIYHELGFMPAEESFNKHRFGWKMAGLLTGIDFSARRQK